MRSRDDRGARWLTGQRALLIGLAVVDLIGASVAQRHRVAGEPLGIGARLDVRRPMVLVLWGSGLSAPLWSLPAAAFAERARPGSIRLFAVAWAAGALCEPVFWGRRPCPVLGRLAVGLHVLLALVLARLRDRGARRSPRPARSRP
jgi:hypothetical protein